MKDTGSEKMPSQQSKEGFGDIRRKYAPKRQEAGDLLQQGGYTPDTSEFQKTRAKVARAFYVRDEEARIDSLTGALSRAEFRKRLEEEAAGQRRFGHKSSLMFLDLNFLKTINDTRGHSAGDQVLKRVAEILRKTSREIDFVGRYGGDEFVVLLPKADEKGAEIYWDRANLLFQRENIRISAGVAEIDAYDIDSSIAKADERMYEAKKDSKNKGINVLRGESKS